MRQGTTGSGLPWEPDTRGAFVPEVQPNDVVPKDKPAGKAGGDGVLLAAVEQGVLAKKTARTKEVGGQWGTEEHADVPQWTAHP